MTTLIQVCKNLSLGTRVLLALAVFSSIGIVLWPASKQEGMDLWMFTRLHERLYIPLIAEWNTEHAKSPVHISLLSVPALERRLLSAFLSGTPAADLAEIIRETAAKTFSGPLDDIGFVDLTDRIHDEGIDKQIVEASFSPWTSRGRIFGLPHDVHPVALAYRADIIEAAGIDITKARTWSEFFHLLAPLMADTNRDGIPDRFILNYGIGNVDVTEALILQAGGSFFDPDDHPVIYTPLNARVISELVSWTEGPARAAVDAPEFSASGNKLKLDGFVLCSIMPDWLSGVWKNDLRGLSGKIKLMPLPAWDEGGLRTSVIGGTMIGVPKAAPNFEASWAVAKYLYLSPDNAARLFQEAGIITPIRAFWKNPMYDKPDPFFCGQPIGRTYINLCDRLPRRSASPFNFLAKQRMTDAMLTLRQYARETGDYSLAHLEPKASELLAQAQASVERQIKKNVFLREPATKPQKEESQTR